MHGDVSVKAERPSGNIGAARRMTHLAGRRSPEQHGTFLGADGGCCRAPARCAITPVAPPTRAPKPNNTSNGGADRGRSSDFRARPTIGPFLLHAASQTPTSVGSVPWHGSFPVTAAGQLRIRTGFPFSPHICWAPQRDTRYCVCQASSIAIMLDACPRFKLKP